MAPLYWPYFCEENIWHLCADPTVTEGGNPVPLEERKAVIVTNGQRQVAMRKQRAGNGGPVLWDYHVVLVARGGVWDLDTSIGVPVALDRWALESFFPLVEEFAPRFRVIDAASFRASLTSDRSHMMGPDGVPLRPLPPWPPIGRGMTLPRFIDLDTPHPGKVLDLDAFLRQRWDEPAAR